MDCKDFDYFNDIVKMRISYLQEDISKLKAVDSLIGDKSTEQKKNEILNTIFVLQDIQSEILDTMQNRLLIKTRV